MRADLEEGADVLMVKPALPYLDVLADARREFDVPLAAYHVSGEYAMIQAAAERGWLDGERAMDEALIAIKRAGADLILTYAAKQVAARLGAWTRGAPLQGGRDQLGDRRGAGDDPERVDRQGLGARQHPVRDARVLEAPEHGLPDLLARRRRRLSTER